jgi:hypothetical protein
MAMFCCALADYDWVEHISSTRISACYRAICAISRENRVNTKEQSNLVEITNGQITPFNAIRGCTIDCL